MDFAQLFGKIADDPVSLVGVIVLGLIIFASIKSATGGNKGNSETKRSSSSSTTDTPSKGSDSNV